MDNSELLIKELSKYNIDIIVHDNGAIVALKNQHDIRYVVGIESEWVKLFILMADKFSFFYEIKVNSLFVKCVFCESYEVMEAMRNVK